MTKSFVPDKKRRPQRVAADTAHSWARNLRLKNPYAKLVLSMLTLYVQGDGFCFVGVKEQAENCEMSEETVRRRLTWLEQVGAITRMPQWLDEHGRRNGDGRGKRTTDEIRLMIDADQDEIEARACGAIDAYHDGDAEEISPPSGTGLTDESHKISPVHDRGLNDEKILVSPPVSPLAALSLRTGAESLEPEPEGFPPTPLSGGEGTSALQESEKDWEHSESWTKVETIWGEPIIHQSICRQIWTAFTDNEREKFIEVVRGYNAWRSGQRRPPNRCNIQKLMRERDAWAKFESLAPPKPKPPAPPPPENWISEDSAEFRALCLACDIARRTRPSALIRSHPGDPLSPRTRAYRQIGNLPAGADAMATLAVSAPSQIPISNWWIAEKGTKQFFAWSERVEEWINRRPEPYRIWLCACGKVADRPLRKDKMSLPPCKEGLLVPSEWPPPKGTGQQKTEHAA